MGEAPPTVPVPQNQPAANQPFKLRWWSAAPLVLAFLLTIVGNVMGVAGDGVTVGRMAGGMIAVLLLCVAPGWVVFRLSRSLLAGNIVCAVMSILVLLGAVASLGALVQRDRTVRAYDRQAGNALAEQRDLLQRSIEGEDVVDEQREVARELAAAARDAGRTVDGPEGISLRIIADILEEIEGQVADYNAAMQAFEAVGGLDATTLTEPGDIVVRLEALTLMEQKNESLRQFYVEVEGEIAKRLIAEGIPSASAHAFAGRWKQGAQPELVVQIRETDRRFIDAARQMLKLWGDSWGKWWIGEDGAIVWDTQEQLTRQLSLDAEIQAAIATQVRVQKEIVDHMKRAQSGGS